MSKTIDEIARQLKDADKKVQLIYAFNGSGKTFLSRKFKRLISPESGTEDAGQELSRNKILYYNAFTEDLFYWDNDLEEDAEPILKIQPNSFTDWILGEQGKGPDIVSNFQHYVNNKLTPVFIEQDKILNGKKTGEKTYPEVKFSFERGDDSNSGHIKISKGEESNFIWSIFYTLLEEVISILNEDDPAKRDDDQFNKLEFVFIDDPVSSLDENHLIELGVNLATLIKATESKLRFVITTHNPLFYNVLQNEFNNKLYKYKDTEEEKLVYKPGDSKKYKLIKLPDGNFDLVELPHGSPFSYHLFLLSELKKAVESNQVRKYHFNFLRNVLEKTAIFLGRKRWEDLLPKVGGNPDPFSSRIINLGSHSAHAGEETADIEESDRAKLDELVNFFIAEYGFWKQEEV